MGNQKLKWTAEEEETLLSGVRKHGPGKWKNILRDPEFADQLSNRSNIDLKDKWRNLSVAPGIQGSKDKIRTPKVKAAAIQLAAIAAAAVTPPASAHSSPVAVLPRSESSDLSIDDSCNIVVDAKNAPRYDGMIFEALSSFTDPNGSDVGAIFNFIEQQRHEVPPNFRRILSSRLRRLAAQGKLQKTQNFYKMNDNSLGIRTPLVARPKEVNVKLRQISQGPTVSQEMFAEASKSAAYKLVEVENKLDVVKGAGEEIEKTIKFAENSNDMLLVATELNERCCQGETVVIYYG